MLQKVTVWKKLYVIYSFFFVRKIIAHMVTFSFYCLVLPLTILVPEVHVPIWGAVYIPSIITILNSVGTPRSDLLNNFVYWSIFLDILVLLPKLELHLLTCDVIAGHFTYCSIGFFLRMWCHCTGPRQPWLVC